MITNQNTRKMKKYIVKYLDKSGDLSSVWVVADDAKAAVMAARHEYWDIDQIVDVYEDRQK